MAVRAVVASSASRRFVMCFGSWEILKEGTQSSSWLSERQRPDSEVRMMNSRATLMRTSEPREINKQALGRIVAAFERERVFISASTQFGRAAVHDAFRRSPQIGN
jgi:hypothetical protein